DQRKARQVLPFVYAIPSECEFETDRFVDGATLDFGTWSAFSGGPHLAAQAVRADLLHVQFVAPHAHEIVLADLVDPQPGRRAHHGHEPALRVEDVPDRLVVVGPAEPFDPEMPGRVCADAAEHGEVGGARDAGVEVAQLGRVDVLAASLAEELFAHVLLGEGFRAYVAPDDAGEPAGAVAECDLVAVVDGREDVLAGGADVGGAQEGEPHDLDARYLPTGAGGADHRLGCREPSDGVDLGGSRIEPDVEDGIADQALGGDRTAPRAGRGAGKDGPIGEDVDQVHGTTVSADERDGVDEARFGVEGRDPTQSNVPDEDGVAGEAVQARKVAELAGALALAAAGGEVAPLGVEDAQLARAAVGDDDAPVREAQRPGHAEELLGRVAIQNADLEERLVVDRPLRDRTGARFRVLYDANPRAVARRNEIPTRSIGDAAAPPDGKDQDGHDVQ